MNIKQAAKILRQEGKLTIQNNSSLQEDVPPYQNYYQLQLNEHKWEYGLWKIERQNNPHLEVEKEFNSEEEGARHFFSDRLSAHYYYEYVQKFIMKHPELGIRIDTIDENRLLKAMSLITIPPSLLLMAETQGKNKAIMLNKKSDDKTVLSFVNESGEIVNSTIPMNNQSALFFAFKEVYMLYLFEKKMFHSFIS